MDSILYSLRIESIFAHYVITPPWRCYSSGAYIYMCKPITTSSAPPAPSNRPQSHCQIPSDVLEQLSINSPALVTGVRVSVLQVGAEGVCGGTAGIHQFPAEYCSAVRGSDDIHFCCHRLNVQVQTSTQQLFPFVELVYLQSSNDFLP